MPRLVVTIAFIVLLSVGIACGGDDATTPTPAGQTSSASPSGTAVSGGSLSADAAAALQVVRDTLGELTRGDVDCAYANLSTDARKEVTLEQARSVIEGLQAANINLMLSIENVGEPVINGDYAEIPMTVLVKFGGTEVPVEDEASLVRENGQWKIADHFLQTALTAVGLYRPPSGTRRIDDDGCATGNPMEGVYAPSRLKVLDPCITVTGFVANDITNAEDGDITFGLIVSGDDKRLVNEVNVQNYSGNLHIEIVPFDQNRVLAPKPGDKVTITGPWVTDLAHGHNEIHPAFKIEPAQ